MHAADSDHRPRERLLFAIIVVAIVLLRSAVFVLWEEAHFDSDQAVMGLMAKHLSEGRAFPVFFYGSNHILAVQAWLAAPVFLLAGVSVAAAPKPRSIDSSSPAMRAATLVRSSITLRSSPRSLRRS